MNMTKVFARLWLPLLLAGCVGPIQPLTQPSTVDARPFPYPGIYTGALSHGSATYQLGADGHGRSCVRGLNGRMAFGDVTYDGSRIYTQDATLDVRELSGEAMRVSAPAVDVTLHRVAQAPTVCREFFASR